MDPAHIVREARLRAGLTQAELAGRAGTTQSALARLESGAASPGFPRVADLVEACGLELRVRIVDPDRSEPSASDPTASDSSASDPSRPPVATLLAPLVRAGVRFVVSARAAASLRGFGTEGTVVSIVPNDARIDLVALGEALGELGARVRMRDGSLPLVRTPEALLSRPRWELVTPEGPLDVVFTPPGTRGYRDLSRDASGVEVGGLELPVASLRDAIRELEAEGTDPGFVHRLRISLGRRPGAP